MRTRVKFCGLTRPQDVEAAVAMGADALGMVFCQSSKRAIEPDRAASLCDLMPAFVTPVGLFVDPPAKEVERVLATLSLALLQFHGDESRAFCESFGLPYIKAVRMQAPESLLQAVETHPRAKAFLVDSYSLASHGGTGETFDWSILPTVDKPIVLAGGLGADNVAAAIGQVRPFAVDVSSNIESVPGVKDADKMRAFLEQVCLADQSITQAGQ